MKLFIYRFILFSDYLQYKFFDMDLFWTALAMLYKIVTLYKLRLSLDNLNYNFKAYNLTFRVISPLNKLFCLPL